MTTPQQPQDPSQPDPNLQGPGQPVQQPDPSGHVPAPYGQQGQYGQPGRPDPYGQVPGQQSSPQGAGQFPQQPTPYGFPAGQFPPPPPPGSPAGPTPSTSKVPRILTAVLVVIVVALGIFLFVQNRKSDPTAAAVGDCLKVEGTTTVGNPKSEQIDCTDAQALFKVTESGGSDLTCDDYELSYVQYQGDDESDVTDTVCLRPNYKVGECYLESASSTTLPKLGPCASIDDSSKLKVDSINENTTDDSVCQNPKLSYVYAKRTEVVCFSEVQ